jgi:hypothetical protein
MIKLNTISTATAIVLAATSGAIATYGLTRVIPGSEPIVIGLGVLFECAKLTSLAIIHRKKLPRTLKVALTSVAVVLMTANVAGVSGLLSSAYSQRALDSKASAHNAARVNESAVGDIKRQLDAADAQISAANAALVRARDNRDRAKAAQAIVTQAQARRDTLATQLRTATATQAQAEASAITATGEFASVAFLASTVGITPDAAARVVITVLSAVPDIAAALLLWASSYRPTPVKRRRIAKRKATKPTLKVVPYVLH